METDTNAALMSANTTSSIGEVEIDLIHANPDQPRKDFDAQALQELANSIQSIGVIQPITLRQEPDGTYMIIAGERRFRASQMAGLLTIPAYIRNASDNDVREMALIENIQREDLNAIEVALAYQQIQAELGLTQDELSHRVGKSRSAVANFMRLLKLPAEIQIALKEKRLSVGHARAILPIEDPEQQVKLFHLVMDQDLSVRRVEQLAKDYVEGRIIDFNELSNGRDLGHRRTGNGSNPHNELIEQMAKYLTGVFNTKVKMDCNDKGQGKITIPFSTDAELQNILSILDKIGH